MGGQPMGGPVVVQGTIATSPVPGVIQAQPLLPSAQFPTPSAPPPGVVVGQRMSPQPLAGVPQAQIASGNMPSCPVCMVNQMDYALGCGHRVCGTCLAKIHSQAPNGAPECPVCRVPITAQIRLFN